jgi:hypothetical protein
MIEQLSAEVCELRIEDQRLRDESNHLKGEQGKPNIKGNKAQGTLLVAFLGTFTIGPDNLPWRAVPGRRSAAFPRT